MITSETGILGLFGDPVEHSISPIFMNYTLKRLNINYRYFAFRINSEDLKKAAESISVLNMRGVNVTIPHKVSIVKYLDTIESAAETIGAVNCILNRDGELVGYNTDYKGFIQPLKDRGLEEAVNGTVCILIGCGGAARAVAYGLKVLKVERCYLINRTKSKAERFVHWCGEKLKMNVEYLGDSSSLIDSVMERATLIVNTTPVGMYPDVDHSPVPESVRFREGQIVYDLIYNPWETRLLNRAKEDGAVAINGFSMLIYQGVFSLVNWFSDRSDEFFKIEGEISKYARNIL